MRFIVFDAAVIRVDVESPGGDLFVKPTRGYTQLKKAGTFNCASNGRPGRKLLCFAHSLHHFIRDNILFIDPPLGGFGEMLPLSGYFSWERSSLRVIFHRIPLAPRL